MPDPSEAHSSPAVNSSESPGRKKPISRPVSANNTTAMPSAPKDWSNDVALSTLTALSTSGLGWIAAARSERASGLAASTDGGMRR